MTILTREDAARLWSKFDQRGVDECWIWTGSHDNYGYGHLSVKVDGKHTTRKAHRLVYEQLIGPIPDGLQLDHLCRVRNCVNPNHLEPVDGRTNVLRGEGISAVLARRETCQNGHEYTPENTRYEGTVRRCRACKRAASMRFYWKESS